jgi:alpha-beta hydrolase superfamily lysophospholipase
MPRNNTFTATDGKTIHYLSWIPRAETQAVVQIVHGMAEHAARYEHTAKYLNQQGYTVYANNHRGHGQTAENQTELGFFAEENGWQRAVEDIRELTEIIKEKEPGKPIVLLGHSMGSFMARTLMILYPETYQAVVLSGTAAGAGITGKIGKLLAEHAVKKSGARTPNKKLDQMSFGSYGKAFEPNRTKFDWLSRDPEQVDAYVDDPYCGFICTSQFFVDLLTGLDFINNRKRQLGMRMDLPVLIASGTMDPVGGFGKGVQKVYDQFKKLGMQDVTLELFEHARHEILNETNREEVEQVIESWMRSKLDVFAAPESASDPEQSEIAGKPD